MILTLFLLGLNSKVVKINGKVTEEVYKSGGKYGAAIDTIVIMAWKSSCCCRDRNPEKRAWTSYRILQNRRS